MAGSAKKSKVSNKENTTSSNANNSETNNKDKSKYIFMNPIVDSICYGMLSLIIFGIYKMYFELEKRYETYSSVQFNKLSGLIPTIYITIIFIAGHHIIVSLLKSTALKLLRKDVMEDYKSHYAFKVITNSLKFSFFIIMTIYGYSFLRNEEYLYTFLGGLGGLSQFAERGIPSVFVESAPEAINTYYNVYLAFFLFEFYLVITQDLQSDFLIMQVHHWATLTLIVFSYITNYTFIGNLVLFILHIGDVNSTLVRVVVYLQMHDLYPIVTTAVFLLNFIITRVFMYGIAIYQLFTFLYNNNALWACELYQISFLGIIYLLSIMWIILISQKFVKFLKTRRIEEIYKLKLTKENTK